MSDIIRDVSQQEAQKDRAASMERLRREGRDFIKVRLHGVTRIQAVKDVVVQEIINPMDGSTSYNPIETERCVEGVFNDQTKYVEADIYDCEYNRYWIAKNMGLGIEVVDKRLARQINSLKDREFKIPTTRKEHLQLEIARMRKELSAIEKKELEELERETPEKEEKPVVNLNNPEEGVYGDDEPTVDVDRTSESRVE